MISGTFSGCGLKLGFRAFITTAATTSYVSGFTTTVLNSASIGSNTRWVSYQKMVQMATTSSIFSRPKRTRAMSDVENDISRVLPCPRPLPIPTFLPQFSWRRRRRSLRTHFSIGSDVADRDDDNNLAPLTSRETESAPPPPLYRTSRIT